MTAQAVKKEIIVKVSCESDKNSHSVTKDWLLELPINKNIKLMIVGLE